MNKKVFFLILTLALFSIALGLSVGVAHPLDEEIFLQIRLPRVLLSFSVGGGLALSGLVLQALFSNPLCDPYTLGVSSGAALGAVVAGFLGLDLVWLGGSIGAALGAIAFTFVLFMFSLRSSVNQVSLLLVGVMLGFLGSGMLALWMAVSDSSGMYGVLQWFLGDLSRAQRSTAFLHLGALLAAVFWALRRARGFDAFAFGEERARALGISTLSLKREIILFSSLLTGMSVSFSGMIGFVGLVVPYFARRLVGSLHGKLIPVTVILGGSLLVISDALSRTLIAPSELPIGVITSLFGAPAFIFIILRGRQESR